MKLIAFLNAISKVKNPMKIIRMLDALFYWIRGLTKVQYFIQNH